MASPKKANVAPYTLPKDFLSGPGPEKVVRRVDWKQTSLPEYDGLYAVVIENVLSKEECNDLVRAAVTSTNGEWEEALVNVGNGKQRFIPEVRDCGRILWDDRDVVEKIWQRVKDSVPELEYLKNMPRVTGYGPIKRKETLKITRLNERMRFLRYEPDQYFRPHMDGCFVTPDNKERSCYTLHLYLNESDPNSPDGPLEGGATVYHSLNHKRSYEVVPKAGRVLIFQQRDLYHSGADVTNGIKLTMRTELMYTIVPDPES